MEGPLVVVVLAGGTGSRLYPASRADRPKQFLSLDGDRSLLEQTLDRTSFADHQYVLTREAYAQTVREVAPEVGILTEPAPKDTGPALVYAAHRIAEQIDDATLLCLPSDHIIDGPFEETARRAARVAASTSQLVTLGIEPDRPATGYGYIEPADGEEPDEGGRQVRRFVEKPDAAQASEYVDAGWYWNSGIFAWTPAALLDAAVHSPLAPLIEALDQGEPVRGFDAVPAASIDNAVLERTDDLTVVSAQFDWADIGTWDGLGEYLGGDSGGNISLTDLTDSAGRIQTIDASNCVLATDGRLSVLGVEDLVVASFDGHTVVVPRDDAERVREIREQYN